MILALGLTILFSVQPAFSQTAEEFKAQQKDIDALKSGQAQIQKDIQEIKKQLAARPAAPGEFKEAIINIKGAPVMGDKNAKLVLMEFTDYQ
jgi:peptidoglycan hydrolase CwlO-like protein